MTKNTARVGQQFGAYRLTKYLGGGSFTDVYLGEHIYLELPAAIKVLKHLEPLEQSKFADEAHTIASLTHPHIVRIIEFGFEKDQGFVPYLVMAYAKDGTLQMRHPRGSKVPLAMIVTYVDQVAQALQYVHNKKIIHRDVKPENMLLNDNKVWLSDFRLAVLAHSEGSQPLIEAIGTLPYMAPEQIDEVPKLASDQYSLGVVVYEWLCGQCPFVGPPRDVKLQIVDKHKKPPSLRAKDPTIPSAIEEVVMRALEKDYHDRYASVEEFAHELSRAYQKQASQQPLSQIRDLGNLVGQQLGNYRLVRLLFESSFGDDYLGEHITSKKQVEVKVPGRLTKDNELEHFRNQIRIHSGFNHPNILQVVESDANGEIPFLTTALVPHGTLVERHPLGSRLPLPTIVTYVKQVADALQYIHDKGYIHLNVKPESMLLGEYDEILLGRFVVVTSTQNSLAQVAGTPRYMAPEQFEGKPVPASDQYALGITVYEWLCGTVPFQGRTVEELRYQHVFTLPPSLREKNPTIPLAVEQVVMRALAKDPQERFASVQEFADAFADAVEKLPTPRYEYVQRLSTGDMTSTLQVRDTSSGELVVLKVLAVTKGSPYRIPNNIFDASDLTIWDIEDNLKYQRVKEAFERGIIIAQSVEHPNILPIIDSGYIGSDNDRLPYLVTPYMPDGSLAQYIEKTPPWIYLSLMQTADLIIQAADALEYLHTAPLPIVHRDIKPSNFLVSQVVGQKSQDRVLQLYLSDFGTARLLDKTSVGTAEMVGSPTYMAPEQFNGYFSTASDQYALAIMACYLLTGKRPFEAAAYYEYADAHKNVDPIPPSSLNPDRITSPKIDAVILQALAKGAGQRFESVKMFADALLAAITEQSRGDTIPPFVPETSLTSSSGSPTTTIQNEWEERPTQPLSADAHHLEVVPSTVAYQIFLATSPSAPITIGAELEASLYLSLASDSDNITGYRFELPLNEAVGGELNILLTAPGFQFNGENVASLPIEIPPESETTLAPQVARFTLVALRPGTAKVSAEVYNGSDFLTNLEAEVQVLGIEEEYSATGTRIPIHSRPVPQPDLILQVQTEWNADGSACTLRYVLNSFHRSSSIRGGDYRSPSLSAGWVERSRRLLGSVLEECADGQSEDARVRLASLGYYLFQSAFPLVLQNELRNLVRSERMLTLLILADQDAWLPWEVLHTGQAFLGEQFVIGRWMRELDEARPYEFPVGGVHVAHYANVPQPEMWVDLLAFPGTPEPLLLPSGVFADLEAAEAMRGLYLMRYGHSSGSVDFQDAPVVFDTAKSNGSIDAEFRPAKLSLRRNRPLVSLGYVSAGQPELTTLEQAWAPTFVRAGCSAFVGPMWAVQPTVQAAFVSGFYSRLWAGDSLAGALQMGRRLAKAVAPDSLDWLAYVLFGDPMARPYRPVQGQGYALVEPIGREMDDPVPAGGSARFRVSLRRTPPVWHEERVIEVAETLHFDNLQVYVVTFGLDVIPPPPIAMKKLTPDGDYLGWFTLSVPPDITTKEVRVQVHFVDGMQPIHSLTFPLKLAVQGGDTR